MGRQVQDSVHVRTRPEINNFFYPCQLPIRTRLPEVGLCMVFNRILNLWFNMIWDNMRPKRHYRFERTSTGIDKMLN